jgi:hypothetical protein
MERGRLSALWSLLFLAIAVPCSYRTSYAQDCEALRPHQAVNSEVSNDIKANAAVRWKIGSGEFENQYKKVQEDVLSKYPNADRLYIWSEFIYFECTLLQKSHFSDTEKQKQFQLLMDKATKGPPAESENEGYPKGSAASNAPSAQPKFTTSRIAYSNRQVLQISSMPGDYNRTLNLDNVAALRLMPPLNRDGLTLSWFPSPPVTIAEPQAGKQYDVPFGGTVRAGGPGIEVKGLTMMGPPLVNIWFDIGHPVRLIRVGDRVFRVSLESVKDKADVTAKIMMFFEYEFAISEEEPTAENRAAAISLETPPAAPQSQILNTIQNETARNSPQGSLESLPGLAAHIVARIHAASIGRRGYVLDIGQERNGRFSVYTESDFVVFAVTDSHGEVFSVKTPTDDTGIPLQ